MRTDEIWRYVDSERASLADLLSGLTAEQWQMRSVCPGWTVQDVAAHVISSPQARVLPVVSGMVRCRGDFNRFVFEEARRAGSQYSPDEIVAQYGEFAGSRQHPLGTTAVDPLLDVLIHGQDIAIPLGIRREMPVDAARCAADRIWAKSFPFKARKRLEGVHLVATDVDWSAGEGAEIRGPMSALLLLLSGRTVSTPQLTGQGVPRL
ncbi:MAG TPA: maleylpyruvate isomerase family mycothiol-dependent enzyme [Kribbella sp.]|uniref:maleylpyruvate isomerase family mycothiol-dependent enzyme n=1 Tax=Kribbella sp. TaxID=1871183 RepID=UPI002D799B8E|nr:maleylpyruvate isomerase family mycothiol-dependent enzyme [Kribbella sp.]HET6292169.1 maleylpyruvate isomerase family mycothiol-dependent enzyme [Kribbella sp.]